MIVLGLDMSSKKSGYALFVDGQLKDYGLWQASEDEKDWRKRISYMAECVGEYCRAHNIEEIYVEDVPPIMENTQTVKVLSALQGMLIAIAKLQKLVIDFVPVKTWKNEIGINFVSSKENNDCKRRVREYFGNSYTQPLNKIKGWAKAWEKKLSVDYANHTFGLDLIYKSPTSKFNQDDIADAINIAWSKIGDVEKYDLQDFKEIEDKFYELVTT